MELNRIIHGDCFEMLPQIPDKSIDMILTDPPYNTTACHWDVKIDLQAFWRECNRIIKDNGAMVICSRQPFTTDVINANRKLFRYEIIWEKTMPLGFLDANRMPLRSHENLLLFYQKLPTYHPQKEKGTPYIKGKRFGDRYKGYGSHHGVDVINSNGDRFPKSVIKISNGNQVAKHPTQKPVDLFSWLIKTYTNEGDIVLDAFSGSGTTAVACQRLQRQFVCIEKEREFYEYSVERLNGDEYQAELPVNEN